ncbi:MAG: hypothetical protein MAG451_00575 [Anaerolineales bacterium]|nr:hypothetical protein [Anaerolineales bacterium]
MGLELPSPDDTTPNVRSVGRCHLEGEVAVVDEQAIAGCEVVRQAGVADRGALTITDHVARREGEGLSRFERNFPIGNLADADARPLQVLHDGDGPAHLPTDVPQPADHLRMALVCAMGEIQPRHVHAGLDHGPQGLRRARSRANRADNLGTMHSDVSYSKIVMDRHAAASSRINSRTGWEIKYR